MRFQKILRNSSSGAFKVVSEIMDNCINDFMKRALKLAKLGRTSPNPMVGAVVVRDGKIVGEGFHPKAGEPHAEVFALREAGPLAVGADVYVTLEPCCHYGKTPPCTEALIDAGVHRVFAAMVDPNPKVAGNGLEMLRRAGIEVHVGICESEAVEINQGFIKRVTAGLPFVIWKSAMSIDGKVASRTGDSRWITGEQARKQVHRLRDQSDAVVTGIGTVLADDPQLTVRGIRGSRNPIRVVVDSRASIPPESKILDSTAPTIIAVGPDAPQDRIDQLRNLGAEVIVLSSKGNEVDLRMLLEKLAEMGVNTVMLESGGELAASMISEGLVDKGILFIAPIIIGGREARTPIEGEGIELVNDALKVSTPKVRRFGVDIALEFSFDKKQN